MWSSAMFNDLQQCVPNLEITRPKHKECSEWSLKTILIQPKDDVFSASDIFFVFFKSGKAIHVISNGFLPKKWVTMTMGMAYFLRTTGIGSSKFYFWSVNSWIYPEREQNKVNNGLGNKMKKENKEMSKIKKKLYAKFRVFYLH